MAAPGSDIEHGYPHLDTVRASITALYHRLSRDTVDTFGLSVSPAMWPSPTRTTSTWAFSGWPG
ncbi:hypothetical protein SANTM175S_09685 [Streptomyces antimycoticus]